MKHFYNDRVSQGDIFNIRHCQGSAPNYRSVTAGVTAGLSAGCSIALKILVQGCKIYGGESRQCVEY